MKEIYGFTVNKEVQVEEHEETAEGTLLKKVTKKVPVKIVLKKPSAREQEKIQSVQAIAWSKGLRDGLFTEAMLTKHYMEHGGLMSKDEAKDFADLLISYDKKRLQFQEFKLNVENEDNKSDLVNLTQELGDLLKEIQRIQNANSHAYENSVEMFARNKTIQWLLLNLTYIEENGILVPFFKGKTDEIKEENYYSILEEDNVFQSSVMEKAILMLSFWISGRATTKEDFEHMEKQIDSDTDEDGQKAD